MTELTDESGTIRAAIIEDEREIREGLALLIGETEGFICSGSFRSMEEALQGIGIDLPDVALVDIGLDHVYLLGGSPVAHPHGARQAAMVQQTKLFAEKVLPNFA